MPMPHQDDSTRYDGYSPLDFIRDPFFQEWIIHPEGEAAAFWEAWVSQHPEQAETVKRARETLEALSFREDFPAEGQALESLTAVRERMAAPKVRTIWWAAAASVLIAIGAYMALHEKKTPQVKQTEYGQMSTLTLPDGSRLILNAHSKATYASNWLPGHPREVWLEGEGYFDVKKAAGDPFLVHTALLSVQVLGTTFDIRERRNTVQVVLQTGSIKVTFPGNAHQDVIMKPGDQLTYDPTKATLNQGMTDADSYTSWTDKKLRDVTVGDVIVYLEDNYDKKIILENPALANRRIGGVVIFDNLDDALFTLSMMLDVKVVTHQDTLLLQHR